MDDAFNTIVSLKFTELAQRYGLTHNDYKINITRQPFNLRPQIMIEERQSFSLSSSTEDWGDNRNALETKIKNSKLKPLADALGITLAVPSTQHALMGRETSLVGILDAPGSEKGTGYQEIVNVLDGALAKAPRLRSRV